MSGKLFSTSVPLDDADAGSVMPSIPEALPVERASPLLSVGQQLRAGREARTLTVTDVAKKLKLSPHQIDAMESDDWSRLPCNTILRGFVRNYARLLGLNSDALMASLDSLHMPQTPELEMPSGTNVSLPHEAKVERRDYVRVFSGLVVLVLAILAYYFSPMEIWQSTLSALKSAVQMNNEPVVESVVSTASNEVKAPEAVVIPPVISVLPEVMAPSAQSSPASAPATTLPSVSFNGLKFSFSQPSWVEVRDRSGEIIFSQLSQAGSQREIDGRPPFTLVIGNATHVSLHYKGKPVDLSRRSKDDVARVTVE
jgi:cytoskeleton protein RodZ